MPVSAPVYVHRSVLMDLVWRAFVGAYIPTKKSARGTFARAQKVNCHNGRPDPAEGWCVCNPGWESESLDHDGFNPDFMVYHMCTVFSGTTANSSPPHSPRGKHTKKHYLANVPKKRRRGEVGTHCSGLLSTGTKSWKVNLWTRHTLSENKGPYPQDSKTLY